MKIKKDDRDIIVVDANILINFLRIDRIDLLTVHPFDFKITDHVLDEVTYSKQRDLLKRSISEGAFIQVSLTLARELEIFARLTSCGNLGIGECSAIAYAIYNRHKLAIDDRLATRTAKNIAEESEVRLETLSTQDIMLSLINEGILGILEADKIKDDWASNHRFRLPFDRFGSLRK